jgi:hypothetical protein
MRFGSPSTPAELMHRTRRFRFLVPLTGAGCCAATVPGWPARCPVPGRVSRRGWCRDRLAAEAVASHLPPTSLRQAPAMPWHLRGFLGAGFPFGDGPALGIGCCQAGRWTLGDYPDQCAGTARALPRHSSDPAATRTGIGADPVRRAGHGGTAAGLDLSSDIVVRASEVAVRLVANTAKFADSG